MTEQTIATGQMRPSPGMGQPLIPVSPTPGYFGVNVYAQLADQAVADRAAAEAFMRVAQTPITITALTGRIY